MATPTFGKLETSRLVELYEEHREVLKGTDRKANTEIRRKKAWEKIVDKLFAETGKKFSVKAAKKRWQNIKGSAKEAYVKEKNSSKKTGGGSPEGIGLSETQQAIVNIEGNTPLFKGIDNPVETSIFGNSVADSVTESFVNSDFEVESTPIKFPTTRKSVTVNELHELQRKVLEKQLLAYEMQIKNQERLKIVLQKSEIVLTMLESSPLFTDNRYTNL